ncbi:MAG: cytochrome c oxidase subunit II [Solirubrobacteraceae bacterium]|jgi:cytochrome c oxidase subunit 2
MSVDTSKAAQPGSGAAKPVSHIRRVLILWVALSIVGVISVVIIFPLINPAPASATASFANTTNVVFTALATPVAMFVLVFVGYSLYAFREKAPLDTPVDQLEDGPPIQASARQQISWLAVTGVLAFFTVAWGMFGFFQQTTTNPPNPLVVNVIGQQWAWTYTYPAQGVTSNVLYLPAGRPVKFRVTSEDVLHGFVIDALGVAIDANPGWWSVAPIVTPTRLGDYYSHCVELCGLYHTFMWSKVYVVSKAKFATWLSANGGHLNAGAASS